MSAKTLFGGGKAAPSKGGYAAHKESARKRQASQSETGRDIGEIPACRDLDLRAHLERDLSRWLKYFFPQKFCLPWSDDHLRLNGHLQEIAENGGLKGLAMPRGSGKTTTLECTLMYAEFRGLRRFGIIIGADQSAADQNLDAIKLEIETNDELAAFYPEICYPIRALEGIAQRARGQLYKGERTRIGWDANEIVLPTIPGSRASGAIIRTVGITGRVRGQKKSMPDGTAARPDFALIDDPQTEESAASESQCNARYRTVTNAVLGLAGPGKKIAAAMPCTVIRPADMADRVLDRQRTPAWRGERCKMMYAMPTATTLWDAYNDLRRDADRRDAPPEEANAFYLKNRETMDAGARPAWPERHNADEYSATQHAMNLICDRGLDFFLAECQNEPRNEEDKERPPLRQIDVVSKLNRLAPAECPPATECVTAFIDVHLRALFYAVVAMGRNFNGALLEYGAWPRQSMKWYDLDSLSRTLQDDTPDAPTEAQIYAGLESLTKHIMPRKWTARGGTEHHIRLCMIDANWGEQTGTVYQFCRESAYAANLLPSHGRGIGPDSLPISKYKQREGEKLGEEWNLSAGSAARGIRHATFDANYWKTFVENRWKAAAGDRTGWTVYGGDPEAHRLLAEHATAEYRTTTQGHGRRVDVWKVRPERRSENHLNDCMVGCAVAASICGIKLQIGKPAAPARPRPALIIERL